MLNFTGVIDGTYTITYADGIFEDVVISGNTSTITATAGSYNDLQILANGCTSALSVNVEVIEFTCTYDVTITVLDENGDPLSGATVTINGQAYITNANGEIIAQLPDGDYNYTVTADGYLNNGGAITVAGATVAETVNMVLETAPVYDVTITVLDENGNPLSGATVTINGQAYITDANGEIIAQLPDGDYGISVYLDGFNPYTGNLNINEDEVSISIILIPETLVVLPPVAVDDYDTAPWIGETEIDVLNNDYDLSTGLDYESVQIESMPETGAFAEVLNNGNIRIDYSSLPEFAGLDSMVYSVANYAGLRSSARIYITVEIDGLTIPDTFSPNNDGYNDFFVIPGIDQFSGNKLTIYNRWGNEVFSMINYDNKWDGKMKGKKEPLPVGTYFYLLATGRNMPLIKGFVYITR